MVESIGQARTSGLNGVKLREAGKGQAGSSIGLDGTAPKIGNAQSPASRMAAEGAPVDMDRVAEIRSEEHTSELQSLMRISYAVFCLKKKIQEKRLPLHINHP